MSEFDDALAEAVQDGIARGGLPGAADAIRRGRRRSLRTRGGVTVLGVAVVAGALGGAGMLGGRAGTAGAASGLGRHASDGILPAVQWPGYDLEHWKVSASGCSAADRSKCRAGDPVDHSITKSNVSEWFGVCSPGGTYPVRRYVLYATQYDTQRRLDANEVVITFTDENAAAAYLADARVAAKGKGCAGVDAGAETLSIGVSTADGVSWEATGHDAFVSSSHNYLVQADDRVAVLRIDQIGGNTLQSTARDAVVLHDLAVALND